MDDIKPVAWVDERAISWLVARKSKSSAYITTKLTSIGPSIERPMPLFDQAALDAAVAAARAYERERWKSALRMKHDYQGACPDEHQPDAREMDCPACKALLELEEVAQRDAIRKE